MHQSTLPCHITASLIEWSGALNQSRLCENYEANPHSWAIDSSGFHTVYSVGQTICNIWSRFQQVVLRRTHHSLPVVGPAPSSPQLRRRALDCSQALNGSASTFFATLSLFLVQPTSIIHVHEAGLRISAHFGALDSQPWSVCPQ